MRAHENGCPGQLCVMATREPEGCGQQEIQQAERVRKKSNMAQAIGEAVGAQPLKDAKPRQDLGTDSLGIHPQMHHQSEDFSLWSASL